MLLFLKPRGYGSIGFLTSRKCLWWAKSNGPSHFSSLICAKKKWCAENDQVFSPSNAWRSSKNNLLLKQMCHASGMTNRSFLGTLKLLFWGCQICWSAGDSEVKKQNHLRGNVSVAWCFAETGGIGTKKNSPNRSSQASRRKCKRFCSHFRCIKETSSHFPVLSHKSTPTVIHGSPLCHTRTWNNITNDCDKFVMQNCGRTGTWCYCYTAGESLMWACLF